MATERITVTFCDVCLADGNRVEGEPLKVSVNAESAAVDLCCKHERELLTPVRNLLAAHGRGKNKSAPVAVPSNGSKNRGPSQFEVRRWARENGIEVKSKGSIPAEVIEQFEEQRQLRLA